MSNKAEVTVADIQRERSLCRIFGSYAVYLKSLPSRIWERTGSGWVSRAR